MENQFIPYEQALELKALGFNEGCIASYTETLRFDVLEQNGIMWHTVTNEKLKEYEKACTVPLYQQAFRWFREKYGIVAEIGINYYTSERKYGYKLYFLKEKSHSASYPYHHLNFEEAELACLKKLIEILKNK